MHDILQSIDQKDYEKNTHTGVAASNAAMLHVSLKGKGSENKIHSIMKAVCPHSLLIDSAFF